MGYWEDVQLHAEKGDVKMLETRKYRCEQTVVTRFNEMPVSTVETKTDYTLQGAVDMDERQAFLLTIGENHLSIFPEQFSSAFEMVEDLEKIKSNVAFAIDPANGYMMRILNHSEIVDNWNKYKKEMMTKYDFVTDSDTRKSMEEFISIVDKGIQSHDTLLKEYEMKLPHSILFDEYLVAPVSYSPSFDVKYSSPLFENMPFAFRVNQKVSNETPSLIKLSRTGTDIKGIDSIQEAAKKIYDRKFKPFVQYDFSAYNLSYNAQMSIDPSTRCLLEADVSICEEVENNAELTISFKMRKIK